MGADRLCAEWLLRCGATCKVVNRSSWYADYNALVSVTAKTRIEAIDCVNSCVNSGGFRHIHGLTALKAVKLEACMHFGDSGLAHFGQVKETLTRLRLSSCPQITDAGLTTQLAALENLEILVLTSLPAVENLDNVVKQLKSQLPNCEIVTDTIAEIEPKFFDTS